jgi:hypothetical protein
VSQLGTFFLSELGDGFTVFLLGNLLIVDTSPVDLYGRIEAVAFSSALVDTFVVFLNAF